MGQFDSPPLSDPQRGGGTEVTAWALIQVPSPGPVHSSSCQRLRATRTETGGLHTQRSRANRRRNASALPFGRKNAHKAHAVLQTRMLSAYALTIQLISCISKKKRRHHALSRSQLLQLDVCYSSLWPLAGHKKSALDITCFCCRLPLPPACAILLLFLFDTPHCSFVSAPLPRRQLPITQS